MTKCSLCLMIKKGVGACGDLLMRMNKCFVPGKTEGGDVLHSLDSALWSPHALCDSAEILYLIVCPMLFTCFS